MSTFTIISLMPHQPDWPLDLDYFADELRTEWPEVAVHFTTEPTSPMVLSWSMYSDDYPFGCTMHNDYQTISADTGWWEGLVPLALWYRRLVPTKYRVHLYSPETPEIEILPDMSPAKLLRVMREGPVLELPQDLEAVTPQEIQKYIEQLGDWGVDRQQAVEILVGIGQQAVPLLLEKLEEVGTEELILHGICIVLLRLKAEGLALLEQVFARANPPLRRVIAQSLWEHPQPEALPLLTSALLDPDPEVQEAAARGLAGLGAAVRPVVGILLEKLNHPVVEVREGIIQALGASNDPAAFEFLLPFLVDPTQRNYTRLLAAGALVELGGRQALEPLFRALEGADEELALNIFSALEKVCDRREIERLSKLLASGKFTSRVIYLLSQLGEGGVKPLVAHFMARPEDGYSVGTALGRMGKAAVGPLLELVQTLKEPQARLQAMFGLVELDEAELISPLIELLFSDPDPQIRYWAASALGKFKKDAAAREALLKALKDEEGEVRAFALKSLTEQGTVESFELALSLVDDPFPQVRIFVSRILGSSGREEALPILEQYQKSDHEQNQFGMSVSREAEDASRRLKAALRERKAENLHKE